ncbi:hypothetical protein EHS25_007338 [Saitozyma podzolica]|uniref:Uncharacterized protein n=1 Tax=Saitozyma podzolica TaxID=1890683 RepID=A0A427XMB6_9TREE|nr:hypothetical protein EHS25_007338 [Saitozyma podzolica]
MLRLDLNDDNANYTSIMVLGRYDELWDSSRYQGHHLPTLGLMVPMPVCDMVFFDTSELPHLVIKLDEVDKQKCTIVITFTGTLMADAFEGSRGTTESHKAQIRPVKSGFTLRKLPGWLGAEYICPCCGKAVDWW